MKKTVLLAILAAWIVYFVLPFEAPAISYFVAAVCSSLLMKYVPPKVQLYVLGLVSILVVVLQGYVVAGLMTGGIVYMLLNNGALKNQKILSGLSENKKIMGLIGINTAIMGFMFVDKFLNGGF